MHKNENRPGYKKTKLGWIPEGWEAVPLENIAMVERGKFSARPRNDPKYYGGNIPFLQTGDVATAKGVISCYSQTLNEAGLGVSRLFPAGTLLITIAANIGDVAEVGFDFACPDSLVAVQPHPITHKGWLKYFLQTQKSYFESQSTQNAQANINLQTIRPLRLPFPPLPEQKAIAEVLSVWDRAIEKTERLIQAKQKRFKGLLQTLINPADKSGWKKVRLGGIAKIKKGSQRNRDGLDDSGAYPAMNGGIGPSGYTDEWNTESNTVTISEGGNSCGFVNYVTQRFWCGGHCYALVNISNEIENEYLFHFLKHHEPALMRLRVGSGLPNIQKKDVDDFLIEFPPLHEQKRIAETLNLAQREIDLLKKLAEKQKLQKRGLMQKLLNGEWRTGAAGIARKEAEE